MLIVFNMEAAAVLLVIGAVFGGIASMFPSLGGDAVTLALGLTAMLVAGIAEFACGLRPRLWRILPVWVLGAIWFAVGVSGMWGVYGLATVPLIAGLGFCLQKFGNEKQDWKKAQTLLATVEQDATLTGADKLFMLREALFCNRWTRKSAALVQHHRTILEILLRDACHLFSPKEQAALETLHAQLQRNYRAQDIRDIKQFLETRADYQGEPHGKPAHGPDLRVA